MLAVSIISDFGQKIIYVMFIFNMVMFLYSLMYQEYSCARINTVSFSYVEISIFKTKAFEVLFSYIIVGKIAIE